MTVPLRIEQPLPQFLTRSPFVCRCDPITPAAAHLAGQTYFRYRREGGPRQTLIPDFLVAAHASVQADRLAATARGYLRAYVPALSLLSP